MTLVVPAVLGGLALAVVAFVSITASRRQRAREESSAYIPSILVHAINDDRCTGCDACVAVCPTNVLDLISNKSRVLRFQDCIQCEACMWACPTEALVMFREGTEPPPLRVPELDEFYQTAVPGQYLIGEVAGKPLVKNAANLGRAVIEHMLTTGLSPRSRSGGDIVDVAIVGSGPGGLSAALTCIHHGLSYVVLEKEQILASTIARYPKGKLVMAEPYDTRNLSFLPVFDSSKEELLPIWAQIIEETRVEIRRGEVVDRVELVPEGYFEVESNVSLVRARRVVLATGTRGKPRTLGVPGENLAKVHSLLEDPDDHRGRPVLVVGGGDSALEATIALADAGAKVILSYRGRSFARAQPKLKNTVESYEQQRRLKIQYQSVVDSFDEDTVTLRMMDGSLKKYPNEAAFVLIGSEPPIKWLNKVGVGFVERPHSYALPQSDQLLLRFLGDLVQDCPQDPQSAIALITGQKVARPPDASGRKWLRSATNLFGRARTLDGPMPLGEFAKAGRKHKGRGRRDDLPPSERTRVLRMLRDEGARLADEESAVHLFRPPTGQVEWGEDADEFVTHEPPRPRAMSPAELDERAPKPAVIVGLAQAAARGPIGSERRRADAAPASKGRVDTGELLEGLIQKDRAKKASNAPPVRPASEPFFDDPTRIAGYDPQRLLAEADQGGYRQAQPNEVTALVDFDEMISAEAGGAVVADSIPSRATQPMRPELPKPGGYDDSVLTSDTRDEPLDRFAELERSSYQGYDAGGEDAATRQVDLRDQRLASLGDFEEDSTDESVDKVEFDFD